MGALGFRHFKALLWKNWLLKRRNACSTCCEILLPVGFVILMVVLFRAFTPEEVGDSDFTNPWSFNSFAFAKGPQVDRVVPFSVTPFRLKLLSRRLALVPGSPDMVPVVDRFLSDMNQRYPEFSFAGLNGGRGMTPGNASLANYTVNTMVVPAFRDIVMRFGSEAELNSYVKGDDYANGQGDAHPNVWAAIVFHSGSLGSPRGWDYSIRMNISEIVDTTSAPTDNLQRESDVTLVRKYLFSPGIPNTGPPWQSRRSVDALNSQSFPGFMTLQLMVDRWIINRTATGGIPQIDLSAGPITPVQLTNTSASRLAEAALLSALSFGSPFTAFGAVFAEIQKMIYTPGLGPQTAAMLNELAQWVGKGEQFAPQQVDVVPFPISGYKANGFFEVAQSVLAFFLTVCLLFPVSRLIRGLVAEKETKLREGMKMMGLSDAALLGSWMTTYALMFLISSVLITLVGSRSVWLSSNKGIIFITFWLYGLSCCSYCYLISVFFSRAKTASTLGVVLFLGGFFPYFALAPPEYSLETKTAASLLSPTAFGFAIDIIAAYENSAVGAIVDNLSVIERNFSLSRALGMIVLDGFLYFVLGWYIDNTLPNRFREFGVARPWTFPLSPAYWREVFNLPPAAKPSASIGASASSLLPGPSSSVSPAGTNGGASAHHGLSDAFRAAAHMGKAGGAPRLHNGPPTDPSFLEPLDATLRAKEREGKAVTVTGLRKEFSTPDGIKLAVDDISLSMHEGQITCLLGHNGAGKSTTIGMLTGLIPPTDGRMSVFGRDVSTDLTAIRRDLGVCPQHDVLWPELTVREHLVLFCAIKGVAAGSVDSEVEKSIREVGLTEKRDTFSAKLSGGQKRKLSVAIALIGGSRVVVLDEPTSGMDPYSRRSTWEALQNARAGRVILLTTHFMDEADLLGDRIIIMANGGVRCAGSSMFLKRCFGVGYVCTVVKKQAASGPMPPSKPIIDLVRSFAPEVAVATNVGAELALRLPLSASSAFPELFGALEARAAELGVETFGVSVTTLEDVFLQVAHGDMPKVAVGSAAGSGFRVLPDGPSGSAAGGSVVEPVEEGVAYVNLMNPAAGQPRKAQDAAAASGNPLEKIHATSVTLPGGESTTVRVVEDVKAGTAESLAAVRAAARKVDGSPFTMFARHFGALFIKRWHNTRRDSKAFCYQLLIPAIMLAVGLGLIKSTQPKDYPSLVMSTSPLNADRRIDTFRQAGPNRVPFAGYWSGANPTDDPALAALFASMPQDSVATSDPAMRLDVSEAWAWDTAPSPLNVTFSNAYPQRDWKRMSAFLLADKQAYKESKYAAYVMTREGTTFDGSVQPASGTAGRDIWTYSLMHNTTFKHGGPTFMNVMNNAILKSTSGDSDARITVRNHPLPFTKRQANLISSIFNFGAAIIIVIAYSFIPASQVQFIVREREVNAKYQQIISGVSLWAYWLANWCYDVAWYAVPGSLAVALIAIFDIREWIGMDDNRAAAVVGIFALYGISVTSSTYLLSWCFKSYSTASNVVLMLNLGASFVTVVAHTIMRYVDSVCYADQRLLFVWRLIPGFNLANTLLDLSFLNYLGAIEQQCALANGVDRRTLTFNRYTALDLPAAGWSLIYMGVLSIVWLGMAIAIDFYMAMPALRQRFSKDPAVTDEPIDEDEDVAAERTRVSDQLASGNITDVILLDNLRKVYPGVAKGVCGTKPGAAKVAVRGLSYGVPVGQVFAFLGINGAGKTTTLSMLSGDALPSSGAARLAGYDILNQQPEVRRLLGYCPQFDALLELMTVREHLQLYGRIKGVRESELPRVVAEKIREFDLSAFENKKAGTLSGGNKRKLSVAIATVGDPQIIFLDEPSTGVDPVARRFMWSVISRIATEQKLASIILTTHSMEEVQALSQRVGIMVGGRLRCLGSIQRLKDRFGKGYQLEVRQEEPSQEKVAAIAATAAAALGGASSVEAATVSRKQLPSVAMALGNTARADEVSESGTGWALAAAFERSSLMDKSIPVADLAVWWAAEDAAAALTAHLTQQAFPGAELVERQGTQLRYRLPPLDAPLGQLFARVEAARAAHGISSYACGQTSLEQIFNGFASQQSEEVGHVRGMKSN